MYLLITGYGKLWSLLRLPSSVQDREVWCRRHTFRLDQKLTCKQAFFILGVKVVHRVKRFVFEHYTIIGSIPIMGWTTRFFCEWTLNRNSQQLFSVHGVAAYVDRARIPCRLCPDKMEAVYVNSFTGSRTVQILPPVCFHELVQCDIKRDTFESWELECTTKKIWTMSVYVAVLRAAPRDVLEILNNVNSKIVVSNKTTWN